MPLSLAIQGAAGRMGRRLIALATAESDLRLVAALDAPASDLLGRDAGEVAGCGPLGVRLGDRCETPFDVLIDFSLPAGTMLALDCCLSRGKPIVIGTTGHTPEQHARIEAASRSIAVLASPNMSVGINVMLRLLGQVAAALGHDYDVEIVETHHRFKADAPSGTAKALLETVKSARLDAKAIHGREGATGPRSHGEIGVHAVRLGDTVGEHVVHLGNLGETISLRHVAHSRDIFVTGALRAARWIAQRPAGLYTLQDVLFGK